MQVAYIGIILYLCTDFPEVNGKIIAVATQADGNMK